MGTCELFCEIGEISKEASKNSDGWPSALPYFPGGTMNEVENLSHRVQRHRAYIETLKGIGCGYQDFYGFGMSEEENC